MPSAAGKAFLLTVIQALRQSALFNGSSKKAWHSCCVSSYLALTASQVGPSLNSLLKYSVVGSNNISTEQDDATAEMSSEYLQSEKEVYRRLDHDDHIVSCLDLSGEGIRLASMENGNLQELPRQTQNTPDQSRQLAWFRAMARALVHIHDCRVLAADISPLRRSRCQAIRL